MPPVESRSTASLQRVGIVRFNPFEDTGGQQSFAVALLDARGDGFVISSLHSRQATRLYMKQITDGKSDTTLGDEEAEAIRQALGVRQQEADSARVVSHKVARRGSTFGAWSLPNLRTRPSSAPKSAA